MPRDVNNVYSPVRSWVSDAANSVPFSPDLWDQQSADFAVALNDLPVKSKISSFVNDWTTDATTLNLGCFSVDPNGVWRIVRVLNGVHAWVNVTTGVPTNTVQIGSPNVIALTWATPSLKVMVDATDLGALVFQSTLTAYASSVTQTLAGKADTATITTALAGKADTATITTALAGKADNASTQSSLTTLGQSLQAVVTQQNNTVNSIGAINSALTNGLSLKQDSLNYVPVSSVGNHYYALSWDGAGLIPIVDNNTSLGYLQRAADPNAIAALTTQMAGKQANLGYIPVSGFGTFIEIVLSNNSQQLYRNHTYVGTFTIDGVQNVRIGAAIADGAGGMCVPLQKLVNGVWVEAGRIPQYTPQANATGGG